MRVVSNEDGDLLSQFDSINENDIPIFERLANLPPEIRNTPHQKMLKDNHTDANKGKTKRYQYLEVIFGFCKTFKKVSTKLGFHLKFKTNYLQKMIYSSMADDINVSINKLCPYVPNLIPNFDTQVLFNEATQNNCRIPYDE